MNLQTFEQLCVEEYKKQACSDETGRNYSVELQADVHPPSDPLNPSITDAPNIWKFPSIPPDYSQQNLLKPGQNPFIITDPTPGHFSLYTNKSASHYRNKFILQFSLAPRK